MAMEIVNQWKEGTGITIAESYGITEVMPITFNHYYPERHVLRSVSHPVHGVEVQIRDTGGNLVEQGKEGGICIRGRNVMKGYLNNPEGTRSSFWEGGWVRRDMAFNPKVFLLLPSPSPARRCLLRQLFLFRDPFEIES